MGRKVDWVHAVQALQGPENGALHARHVSTLLQFIEACNNKCKRCVVARRALLDGILRGVHLCSRRTHNTHGLDGTRAQVTLAASKQCMKPFHMPQLDITQPEIENG